MTSGANAKPSKYMERVSDVEAGVRLRSFAMVARAGAMTDAVMSDTRPQPETINVVIRRRDLDHSRGLMGSVGEGVGHVNDTCAIVSKTQIRKPMLTYKALLLF